MIGVHLGIFVSTILLLAIPNSNGQMSVSRACSVLCGGAGGESYGYSTYSEFIGRNFRPNPPPAPPGPTWPEVTSVYIGPPRRPSQPKKPRVTKVRITDPGIID